MTSSAAKKHGDIGRPLPSQSLAALTLALNAALAALSNLTLNEGGEEGEEPVPEDVGSASGIGSDEDGFSVISGSTIVDNDLTAPSEPSALSVAPVASALSEPSVLSVASVASAPSALPVAMDIPATPLATASSAPSAFPVAMDIPAAPVSAASSSAISAPAPDPVQPMQPLGGIGGAGKWYIVTRGLRTGVFQGWSTVQPLVIGIPSSCYSRYSTEDLARAAYKRAVDAGLVF